MIKPVPPCAVCGAPVEMELESLRVSSGLASTALVFEHPKQVACATCGSLLHLVIVGVENVKMKTVQVPPAQRQLVVPVNRVRVG
jgi:hypothetical protein